LVKPEENITSDFLVAKHITVHLLYTGGGKMFSNLRSCPFPNFSSVECPLFLFVRL